jgi:uncharacterized protein with HEPN domain
MLRDLVLAEDILTAARLITIFTIGYDEAAFNADVKTQSATLHQLLIIGEAVKGLSADFRAQYTDVPWRDMRRMRDILIHRYHNVDLPTVWLTIVRDIPILIVALEPVALLAGESDSIDEGDDTL